MRYNLVRCAMVLCVCVPVFRAFFFFFFWVKAFVLEHAYAICMKMQFIERNCAHRTHSLVACKSDENCQSNATIYLGKTDHKTAPKLIHKSVLK